MRSSCASAATPQQQRIRLTMRCEAQGKDEELRLPAANKRRAGCSVRRTEDSWWRSERGNTFVQLLLLLERDGMALLARWDQARSLISLQTPGKALFDARGRFGIFDDSARTPALIRPLEGLMKFFNSLIKTFHKPSKAPAYFWGSTRDGHSRLDNAGIGQRLERLG